MTDTENTSRPAESPLPWTLGAVGLLAIVWSIALGPFVRAFRLRGDDFALVWNSARPYLQPGGVLKWFTEGYSDYFWNYPDWPSSGFQFARPVVNVAFFFESLFVPLLGESAYLVVSLVVLFATTVVLAVVLRRYTNASAWVVGIALLVLGLSPVWYDSLYFPSFVTNTLGLFFALGALALLDPRRGAPQGWRLAGCVALLVLAVGSHETAIVAPFVCVALLYGVAPKRPSLAVVGVLLSPVALFVIARLAVFGVSGSNYVSGAGGVGQLLERLRDFAAGPLLPFNSLVLRLQLPSLPAIDRAGYYIAVLVNVAVLATLVVFVVRRPPRRAVALVAAVTIACAPGFWMYGEPRFMGFSMVVATVVLMYLMAGAPRWRAGLLALALAAQALLFHAGVVEGSRVQLREVVYAGEFFDSAQAAVASEKPAMVLLPNDRVGYGGSLAMLRMIAWPRDDASLVVLNNYAGPANDSAELSIVRNGGSVDVFSALGQDQVLYFWGVNPDFETPNQGFQYSDVMGGADGLAGTYQATGSAPIGRTLVVGTDPRTQSILTPKLY